MFEDYEAPLPFVDVKALQRYVDKVCVQYLHIHDHALTRKSGTGAPEAIQREIRRSRQAHGGSARLRTTDIGCHPLWRR